MKAKRLKTRPNRCLTHMVLWALGLALVGALWLAVLSPAYAQAPGTVDSHQKISDTQGNFTGALDDSDTFGIGVAALGDLDGDGVTDLAWGQPRMMMEERAGGRCGYCS